MNAPTPHQMRILKLMAAGVELHAPEPPARAYQLKMRGTAGGLLLAATVKALAENGWVKHHAGGRWILTELGRGHAECFTFVRAFAEEVRVS